MWQAIKMVLTKFARFSIFDVIANFTNSFVRLVEIYFDSFRNGAISGEASPTFGHANANSNFCVLIHRQNKKSISNEMNNDNGLNLHLHDQMSGWLRYWVQYNAKIYV